ncbi:TPM domain-containing protein, partial [Nostoc ellipsosporum NOK]|nr:TPM domain-containing protein [Nostoc ellipsosporum NOK]
MKKLIFLLTLFTLAFAAMAQVEKAIPARPNPPRLVNDFTGTLTPDQAKTLEDKLVAYDDSTSNQIAVIIVSDLKGYSAEDFAMAIGRQWGVGNKDFNNGVVLLVSTGGGDGNRDVTIQVGYGLEGVITDYTSHAIIETELVPNFKAGNIYRGLDEATTELFKAAEGRYKAPEGYGSRRKGSGGISPLLVIIIVVIALVIMGIGGGSNGGYVSRRGYTGWGGGGW